MKKIAVYYDSLLSRGGAERVVIELANMLDADIITSGYDKNINDWLPIKNNVIDVGNIMSKYIQPLGVLFEAPLRYYLSRNRFKYEINIFFGFTSIFASNPDRNNIWYCFTPNRIIYDLRQTKFSDPIFIRRALFKLNAFLFHKMDQMIIKNNFRKIVSQSYTIKKRVKKYYNLDSSVIYDPVDLSKFKFLKFGDFYLTVSRLFQEKRVDLIINAFITMPDKKLIIVGNGPELDKLNTLIQGCSNITLLSSVNDPELSDLYSNCLATIFMGKDEDFGLIPVESMASGKICIAVNEGGCRETITHESTGFLIKPTVIDIVKTVRSFDTNKAKLMKEDCLATVKKFDKSSCLSQWRRLLNELSSVRKL